jgi:hypothetical protein
MTLPPTVTSLAFLVLAFGIFPGMSLRVIVLLYPPGHDRRRELVAELYAMPFRLRPLWVGQQLETAVFEGPPARLLARRERVASRRRDRSPRSARPSLPPGRRRAARRAAAIGVAGLVGLSVAVAVPALANDGGGDARASGSGASASALLIGFALLLLLTTLTAWRGSRRNRQPSTRRR